MVHITSSGYHRTSAMETQCGGLWCAAKMQSGLCRNGNESDNALWDILHKAREETLETGVPIETVRRC